MEKGEIFGLIGPNGSGKSTIVNLITGLLPPTSGRIVLDGRDVSGLPTHRRVAHGIARTFQNIRLFGQLTVWQNLWVAENRDRQQRAQPVLPRWLGGGEADRERIGAALEFSGLAAQARRSRRQPLLRRAAPPGACPRAGRRAQAAAARRAGRRHERARRSSELDARIRRVRDSGVTVLLIEHHMELVMAVTDRIAVLNFGQKIAEGHAGRGPDRCQGARSLPRHGARA